MKDRLRNIGLGIAIATAGVGVEQVVYGQEPAPQVEDEELDVSPLVEAVREVVKTDAEPKFFKQMERRGQGNPDKYFQYIELPDGDQYVYYPDGFDKQGRVMFTHSISNGVGNEYNGVEAGLNFFMTTEEVRLELGGDGTLAGEDGIDLFTFTQLQRKMVDYFQEPLQVRDLEWTNVDPTPDAPKAVTFKEWIDDSEHYIFGANQGGHLVYQYQILEIPALGTDMAIPPSA